MWAKRQALGIAGPPTLVRRWTEEEDKVALSKPIPEAAKLLNRSVDAVSIRKGKLRRKLSPEAALKLLSPEEVKLRVAVPRYDSIEQEEKVRFVGGPYAPPLVPIGGWLKCQIRGMVQVGGYTNALIPWPVAVKHPRQMILCGDLLTALKTESRLAVCFHFGISPQSVSGYKKHLGIERLTAGGMRLFWKTIKLSGSDEARAKMSRQREGRRDLMTPEDRERLRAIQKRPKTEAWKAKVAERWQRRHLLIGRPEEWTPEQIQLIGSMPDREVAKRLNRSVLAVKAKRFQLQKARQESASGTAPPAANPPGADETAQSNSSGSP